MKLLVAAMLAGAIGTSTEAAAGDRVPALDGATGWLNSEPLDPAALRGKVVLVDFWTYTCINWLRTLPYVRAWAEKYAGNSRSFCRSDVRFSIVRNVIRKAARTGFRPKGGGRNRGSLAGRLVRNWHQGTLPRWCNAPMSRAYRS